MKYLVAAALSMASAFTFAAETVNNQRDVAASGKLDIAKVISITSAQDPKEVRGIVDMKMRYLDSQGNTQTLKYIVLGEGQQNG